MIVAVAIGIMQGIIFVYDRQTDAGATAEFVDASTYRTRVGDVPMTDCSRNCLSTIPFAGYGLPRPIVFP